MRYLTTIILIAMGFNTRAQKLPNVQQVSVKAPASIMIDGKANDWGDKFETNNTNTELLYIMANDDNKLYLVAQTISPVVMNRIANGGIKLVIQKNGTKTDAGAPFIKFPVVEKNKRINVNFMNIISTGKTSMKFAPEPKNAAEAGKVNDSLAKANNKKLISEQKFIYTSGIAGVDSLLAIYNDKGIQVANAVDSKKVYTWEMAIDLKLLGLHVDKAEKFAYHIVVNGEPHKSVSPFSSFEWTGRVDGSSTADEIKKMNETEQRLTAERYATTDFWGDYTLVK